MTSWKLGRLLLFNHTRKYCCESWPQTFPKIHHSFQTRSLSYNTDPQQRMASPTSSTCNLSRDARLIFDATVKSVQPVNMVKNAMRLDGDTLWISNKDYNIEKGVHVVAFGKAVLGMIKALEDVLGNKIVHGVASVPHGMQQTLKNLNKMDLLPSSKCKVKIIEGSPNNIPDEMAFGAALDIEALVGALDKDDVIITLISGGGSALLPYPCPPITLAEMISVTKLLSRAGASIQELNTVRKHLEVLKGGGLVRAAYPAKMATLILSDVIGDDMDFIASGPTVPNMVHPSQSLSLIRKHGLESQMPESVRQVLRSRGSSFQSSHQNDLRYSFPHSDVQNVLVGTNTIALEAGKQAAESLGYLPVVLTASLNGEVHVAAALFSLILKFMAAMMFGPKPADGSDASRSNTSMELELVKMGFEKEQVNEIRAAASKGRNSRKPVCILAGGETTVEVKGQGKGGRNQEMALLVAKVLHQLKDDCLFDDSPVFLSAGTDGQDGPTDAAGAIVDAQTIINAEKQTLSSEHYLTNNDSYSFFSALDEGSYHVITGLTGTNVMDIQIVLLKPNKD